MATISRKKIIDKFIHGELKLHHQRNEEMPLEYYGDLRECITLEDLIDVVNTHFDAENSQAHKYILNILDYDEN